MKKVWMLLLMVLVCGGVALPATAAEEDGNLTIPEVKKMIAEEAREQGIPPEILKAVAAVENGYRQFEEDGSPVISPDGGIGVMQVTPENVDIPLDEDKLRTDIEYNIEIGAAVLNNKWELSYLPDMNGGEREVLENWYFAVMAYNGLSAANDPEINPGETYPEKVYERIENFALIGLEGYFKFPEFAIRYEEGNEVMFFPEEAHYETETITPSQQMYVTGDIVYTDERDGSLNMRDSSLGLVTDIWPYTPLTITGETLETDNPFNDYVYYKVEGVEVQGYVASAYLNQGTEDLIYEDPVDDQRAAALAFSSLHDYLQGYPDGRFGSHEQLTRHHAAVILDNILSLETPADYEIQADDVTTGGIYYEQLRRTEYHGLLGGGGKLRPTENFTRSQMAQVMVEAFPEQYEEPVPHTFQDQEVIWNPEAVNTIYTNGITVADPFRPNQDITRSQFAIFIYRTLVDM
ncbi:S-layer homology domain-containing protein [Virgibacillus sediminis]|uniref:S-layer homology domain-containing protein n=1 Tax=Virgibacillus sediminis TaxID=202260 RepID=A0ABV7A498_9BACI